MKPVNGMNPARVTYFPLEEYVRRIKVDDKVLFHLEDTESELKSYLNLLNQYGDCAAVDNWISNLFNYSMRQLNFSSEMEKHLISPRDMMKAAEFGMSDMNHEQIKRLHRLALGFDSDDVIEDYRDAGHEVKVSTLFPITKEEKIYWHGAQGVDVRKFMDDFVTIYKSDSSSKIDSSPLLKSALVSLLFVRVHPFMDGNGRTSRMINNIKITEAINSMYDTKFRLCPLDLSKIIMGRYREVYGGKINDIYFDLEHENNDEINAWFDFMLTMADEELYFDSTRLKSR